MKIIGPTLSWEANRKMSIGRFNLPCKIACPGSTAMCRAKCYAQKAEHSYRNVLPCRQRNMDSANTDSFVPAMVAQLSKHNPAYFRIHESGDFYNQAYLDKWAEISRQTPSTTYLAFTKCWGLDWSHIPGNVVVYWSVWPDSIGVPESGPKAYAGDCGSAGMVECAGHCDQCMMCFAGQVDVHFKVH